MFVHRGTYIAIQYTEHHRDLDTLTIQYKNTQKHINNTQKHTQKQPHTHTHTHHHAVHKPNNIIAHCHVRGATLGAHIIHHTTPDQTLWYALHHGGWTHCAQRRELHGGAWAQCTRFRKQDDRDVCGCCFAHQQHHRVCSCCTCVKCVCVLVCGRVSVTVHGWDGKVADLFIGTCV